MNSPGATSPDLVEAAFYDAFANGDVASMRRLWAEQDAVCVHPGASPIFGKDAILNSWAKILEGAHTPLIETKLLQRVAEPTLVLHVLEEHIQNALAPTEVSVVLATNVYRLIDGVWRMVLHQGALLRTVRKVKPTLQ